AFAGAHRDRSAGSEKPGHAARIDRQSTTKDTKDTEVRSFSAFSSFVSLVSLVFLAFLAEHLRLEPPHLRAALPRVARQPRLVTRLRDKRLAVPIPFRRDLRQEQASVPPHFHHQAMAADLDIVGKGNRLERTQHRDLELEMRELGGADRRKSWIGAGCGDGAAQDHAAERLVSVHMANAPAQFA